METAMLVYKNAVRNAIILQSIFKKNVSTVVYLSFYFMLKLQCFRKQLKTVHKINILATNNNNKIITLLQDKQILPMYICMCSSI